MTELSPCPSCGNRPGTKVGPPALARCVTNGCPGKDLAAQTLDEWNVYAGQPKTGNRYRHKVRGTSYRILFEAAKASSIIAALDDMTMVVYQGEADGLVWVRPAIEFFDGRFERLP